MADVVTAWRRSAPAHIDRDLSALWRETGRDGAVTRAVMANLVIVSSLSPEQTIESEIADRPVIDEVSLKHPSRVIQLLHVPSEHHVGGPDESLVRVLTWGPANARYGVEQIAVRARCTSASLPSIVRGLSLGSLPTIVWWTDDLSRSTPLHDIMTMGRQLVFDSRRWQSAHAGARVALTVARRAPHLDLRDVNWRRLVPVRQALVALSKAGHTSPRTWRLEHRAGESVLAWLAAGWLVARDAAVFGDVTIRPFGRDSSDILTMTGEDDAVVVRMDDSCVEAAHRGSGVPLVLAVRREEASDAVASELKDLRRDVCLHDVLGVLAHFTAPGFAG